MSLSERLQSIHFNKGAIGYNTKEVDAFVAELRTAAERDESALRTLRAKLDALRGAAPRLPAPKTRRIVCLPQRRMRRRRSARQPRHRQRRCWRMQR